VTVFPSNILGSLQIARSALLSQQTALNTIGHNLANAATPGYTRQRTEFAPAAPQLGVDVQTIRRIKDRFLDFSLLTEQQGLGKAQSQAGMLQRLQAIFNDQPGAGLSSMLDQFFQTFQDLSVNPADQALRVATESQGERIAGTFQGLRARVDQLKGDLTTEIQNRVTDANSLLTQIADLHRQIIASRGGPPPNDLLDRRDQLVTQLAQIIGVSATDRADGTVQLAVAGTGVLLVDGTSPALLTATLNSGTDTVNLTAGASSLAITPSSGALASVVTARNSATGAVKQAASDLNTLASSLIAEVNRIHASGTGLTESQSLTAVNAVSAPTAALTAAGLAYTPVTGSFQVIVHDAGGAVMSSATIPVTAGATTLNDLQAALSAVPNLTATISGGKLTVTAAAGDTFTFAGDTSDALMALGLNTFFTGSDALGIAVNPLVANDVTKIATAQADAGGLVHAGDGSNALALARLRTKLAMGSGTATFTDFFATTVGRIGSQMRDATQALDRQQTSVQVVQNLQQQTSGVSTDEEMINLTQSQNAYAAAARYATTIQSVLDTLLQMAT
jgi:flagellar hook-associated protein 1 FlgK